MTDLTSSELDMAIAKRIMGWKQFKVIPRLWKDKDGRIYVVGDKQVKDRFAPSEHIEATWAAMLAAVKRGICITLDMNEHGVWCATYGVIPQEQTDLCKPEDVPVVMCRLLLETLDETESNV